MRSLMLQVAAALVVSLGAACLPKEKLLEYGPLETVPPPRPPGCVGDVPPGGLERAIASAVEGATLCLAPGKHPGHLVIDKRVTLWGPREAVIASDGVGTTVRVAADGVTLLGFTVDGSGSRFDIMDAAVLLNGKGAHVEGLKVVNATFGIMANGTRDLLIRNNHVVGIGGEALGMRGDSIRLWETHSSRLENNLVEHGRDLVVWYSSDNVLVDNVVRHSRYGTHFMYSHRNRVDGGRYLSNEVGIFVMYSREIRIEDTLLADNIGPAGMGLGLKEAGNVWIENNLFIHNTTGLFVDTSPLRVDELNTYVHNEFRLGEVGVTFHSSPHRNEFRENRFRDNFSPVMVDGGGDAIEIVWRGNEWDDYQGFDLNGDGVGDVAYELRDLSQDLTSRQPHLAFFRGTPSLWMLRAAGQVLPLFAPKTLLRDPIPAMPGRIERITRED